MDRRETVASEPFSRSASANVSGQLGNVLERVSDAIVALDKNWHYTFLNRQAGRLFNRSPEELIGKHIWTEFPEGVGQPFQRAYETALAEQRFIQIENYYEPWHRWYEKRIYPSLDGLSIFFHDITEQKEVEQSAKEASDLLRGQNRVLKLIAQGAPLRETLDLLLRIIEEQSPGLLASILLLDNDGVHVRHGAAPSLPESYIRAVDGEAIGAAAGSCGTAAYRRAPVLVEDIATDPLWINYRRLALEHGLRACWSTPIFDEQGRLLGTFALYFRTPGRPSDRHLKQIEMATHTASIAIVKNREQAALATAEQRLRLAIDAGTVGIWERDVKTNRLTWSRQLKAILGYSSEEENLTFDKFLDSVHPDDRSRMSAAGRQAIAEHKSMSVEYRVVWPDGSVHWILAKGRAEYDRNGQPVCMRGIGLDITDRKQMEEELKLREALLADAQRIANFGSFEWQPDTNAVRWTEELFRIFGLRPGEFQPTLERYIERVHPDERQDTRNRIEQSLQDGTAFEAEERIVRPDGSIRLLLSQGKWLLDEARHAKKLVGTCHDITERRATERSKTRLEAEVQQFQKMESVGRLAGGLAHDFNNLLTVILGHASLCEQGLPPDSPARVSLAKIQHAAEDAATLTRHLLTFSRRQVVHPIGLDLNAAIEKISAMLTRVIGEHISLHIIRAESLNRIRADAGQIDQILMNLVLNAVEAMPKGGEIFIETANVELDENYAKFRPPVGPGSYVMLSVADTGSGMDSQTLSRIFDPFFITKQAGAATGLGLSIVQRAVEQNNGQITVSSQPGKGTTFKIYFPRVSGPSDVVSSSAEESLPKGSGTILLVEDDEAVRELTMDLLTSHGYKVLAARNGADALDVSHRHRHKIDLLLTDVVMPEISGPDLADKLKVHHPDLNVLYMSGYAGRLLAHHGILKMDSAFLSKPFTKHDLLVQVGVSLKTNGNVSY